MPHAWFTESDETWRLERAKKQGGGPAIAEYVGEKLLQTTEALMEKDSDAQVCVCVPKAILLFAFVQER